LKLIGLGWIDKKWKSNDMNIRAWFNEFSIFFSWVYI
jgi:hypothetical protein